MKRLESNNREKDDTAICSNLLRSVWKKLNPAGRNGIVGSSERKEIEIEEEDASHLKISGRIANHVLN